MTDGNLVPDGALSVQGHADRVSVEEAPVKFTNLSNPLLQHRPTRLPRKISKGGYRSAGCISPSEWDSHYQTVFESHDPGEKPLAGGMLYARYGKGVYIFSGYSWFRQLPAGVTGAYRVFANMLSGGRD